MATEGDWLANEAVGGAQVSTSVQHFWTSCCACGVKKVFLTIVCAKLSVRIIVMATLAASVIWTVLLSLLQWWHQHDCLMQAWVQFCHITPYCSYFPAAVYEHI